MSKDEQEAKPQQLVIFPRNKNKTTKISTVSSIICSSAFFVRGKKKGKKDSPFIHWKERVVEKGQPRFQLTISDDGDLIFNCEWRIGIDWRWL
ncbi:hypothetical protein TNCV_405651 [Trichonephila clavipes]|nr:hypothetical protein TNCV_405651 [Trichonephila clavipes]